MTPELQAIGERVAEALDWTRHSAEHPWWDGKGNERSNPSDPAECFKLCAEFNVWPSVTRYSVRVYSGEDYSVWPMQEDYTPTGRLNAAIEAVLLAVLAIKEQS